MPPALASGEGRAEVNHDDRHHESSLLGMKEDQSICVHGLLVAKAVKNFVSSVSQVVDMSFWSRWLTTLSSPGTKRRRNSASLSDGHNLIALSLAAA